MKTKLCTTVKHNFSTPKMLQGIQRWYPSKLTVSLLNLFQSRNLESHIYLSCFWMIQWLPLICVYIYISYPKSGLIINSKILIHAKIHLLLFKWRFGLNNPWHCLLWTKLLFLLCSNANLLHESGWKQVIAQGWFFGRSEHWVASFVRTLRDFVLWMRLKWNLAKNEKKVYTYCPLEWNAKLFLGPRCECYIKGIALLFNIPNYLFIRNQALTIK